MRTASYRAIVRTEIAEETLNYAQALVMDRIYQVRDTDPAMAEELRAKARKVHDLRASLRTDKQDAVRAVIEEATGTIQAIQVVLGHTKTENIVQYLGVDVDDALRLIERAEI